MNSVKKKKTSPASVSIKDLCAAIDKKERTFYDSLSEDQKKKFSGYLGLRYASLIQGSKDLQEYYLIATNLLANKKFFEITNEHTKLQWLLLTTISPNVGINYHSWIGVPSNKNKEQRDRLKLLLKKYPDSKIQDLELYGQLMTDEEFKLMSKESDYE